MLKNGTLELCTRQFFVYQGGCAFAESILLLGNRAFGYCLRRSDRFSFGSLALIDKKLSCTALELEFGLNFGCEGRLRLHQI